MSYDSGANVLAIILAAAMLLIVVMTQLAASGKIGRNSFVGIRIPPTLDNDSAWTAGHRAALVPLWIGFALAAVTAVVAQVCPVADAIPIAILLVFLAVSVAAAWRGANSAID